MTVFSHVETSETTTETLYIYWLNALMCRYSTLNKDSADMKKVFEFSSGHSNKQVGVVCV